MHETAELESKLGDMGVEDFIDFLVQARLRKRDSLRLTPQGLYVGYSETPRDPDDWKRRQIIGLVAMKHNNPPLYDMVLRAAGIPTDESRAVDAATQSAGHSAEANRLARQANALSYEANDIAQAGNDVALEATKDAANAKRVSVTSVIIAAVAALAALASAVVTIIALVKN